MITKDVLHEYLHGLCRNHANSSGHGQCPGPETIELEGQWMWRRVKALTNVTIWSLLLKLSRDILLRSPAARGETSKRRTSSKSTSIEIENPWSGHSLGCPETVFQVRNSRVNVWGKTEGSSTIGQCHIKGSSYLDRIFKNINVVINRLINQSQWRLKLQKYW